MADHRLARISVIEDEPAMRTVLRDILAAEGYRVMVAADGEAGLQQVLEQKPALLLLDVMLPKLDGYALCAELRRLGVSVPVLMLTAKGQIQDRVTGLDCGADDYLVKPFSMAELLARVRALLRRVSAERRAATAIVLGQTRIDLLKMTALRDGRNLHLSAREYAMLRLLAEAGGEPVTRQCFLDIVWGHASFPTTRTVDNHIAALRAKLEIDPEQPRWILTVHGTGYRLVAGEILQNSDNSCPDSSQNSVEGKI